MQVRLDLFTFMESVNLLDPNDEVHIFCLHYVFIARINRQLSYWKNSWIKHPMRSEHNLTPQQLWTAGLQRIAGSRSIIAKEVFEDFNDVSIHLYGLRIYTCSYHNIHSTLSIGTSKWIWN